MEYSRFALGEHENFVDWLRRLPCLHTRMALVRRLDRLRLGHVGEVKPVGKGVFALKFNAGRRSICSCTGAARRSPCCMPARRRRASPITRAMPSRWRARSTRETLHEPRPPFRRRQLSRHPQARATYLQLAFESNDPSEIVEALGAIARAVGMTEVARKAGVGRESLYKSLGSSGNPELGTLLRVMQALGLRLGVLPEA